MFVIDGAQTVAVISKKIVNCVCMGHWCKLKCLGVCVCVFVLTPPSAQLSPIYPFIEYSGSSTAKIVANALSLPSNDGCWV